MAPIYILDRPYATTNTTTPSIPLEEAKKLLESLTTEYDTKGINILIVCGSITLAFWLMHIARRIFISRHPERHLAEKLSCLESEVEDLIRWGHKRSNLEMFNRRNSNVEELVMHSFDQAMVRERVMRRSRTRHLERQEVRQEWRWSSFRRMVFGEAGRRT